MSCRGLQRAHEIIVALDDQQLNNDAIRGQRLLANDIRRLDYDLEKKREADLIEATATNNSEI